MATLQQLRHIRFCRNELGYTPKKIAYVMDLPVEEVRKALVPRRKKDPKRKVVRAEIVLKLREEYEIMLENGYKKKYIREELSRWYRVKPSIIQGIVTGKNYKHVQKGNGDQ
jgi:hypothetical protein